MKLRPTNDATSILPITIRAVAIQANNIRNATRASFVILVLVFSVLVFSAALSFGQNGRPTQRTETHSNASAEARGKYIVEDLSRCGQCHTPRDEKGNPDRSRWLQGAPVWLKSAEPVEDWPLQAPRIGGTLPGTDEEMIKLLTTGVWNTGIPLRAPMPQFRMTPEDAAAVVAYLKSVQPASK